MEQRNEYKKYLLKQIVKECVDRCLRKYLRENVNMPLNETKSSQDKEQMLVDLYNYLAQESTEEIYDNYNGTKRLNTSHKAYNYFEPKGIVHNVWAIHYTYNESWENIKRRGFRFGVTNFDELAYTGNYKDWDNIPKSGGWNFALPIDNKYLGEDCGYGDCGFIIKTDGVRAYHKGDGDDEIIFKGCMVKKKYPFVYDEDYKCWILAGFGYNYKNEQLPNGAYYDEDLEQVVFEDVYSLIQYVISK